MEAFVLLFNKKPVGLCDISIIKTKLQNTIPRFIYFAGVDGSGKSTYVEMLIKEFERRGLKAKRVWLRFNYFLTKPVLLYCRLTGLTRRPVRGRRKISVHDFYRSHFIGNLVQYLHLIDTCLHYIIRVVIPLKFTKTYILCDRFVYDILADFMIENRDMSIPKKRISKLLLGLLPANALIVYFKVDKEEIVRRKPEVLDDDEDYDFKYAVYQELEKYFNFDMLDNSGSIQSVFDEVLKQVDGNSETQEAPQKIRLESEESNAI